MKTWFKYYLFPCHESYNLNDLEFRVTESGIWNLKEFWNSKLQKMSHWNTSCMLYVC